MILLYHSGEHLYRRRKELSIGAPEFLILTEHLPKKNRRVLFDLADMNREELEHYCNEKCIKCARRRYLVP